MRSYIRNTVDSLLTVAKRVRNIYNLLTSSGDILVDNDGNNLTFRE